jgi:hypothetical protein
MAVTAEQVAQVLLAVAEVAVEVEPLTASAVLVVQVVLTQEQDQRLLRQQVLHLELLDLLVVQEPLSCLEIQQVVVAVVVEQVKLLVLLAQVAQVE